MGKIMVSQVNMFYKKLSQAQESKATWLIIQFFGTKDQFFSSSGGNKLSPGIFQESHSDQDLDFQVVSVKTKNKKGCEKIKQKKIQKQLQRLK